MRIRAEAGGEEVGEQSASGSRDPLLRIAPSMRSFMDLIEAARTTTRSLPMADNSLKSVIESDQPNVVREGRSRSSSRRGSPMVQAGMARPAKVIASTNTGFRVAGGPAVYVHDVERTDSPVRVDRVKPRGWPRAIWPRPASPSQEMVRAGDEIRRHPLTTSATLCQATKIAGSAPCSTSLGPSCVGGLL